jgi:hypothetical protein
MEDRMRFLIEPFIWRERKNCIPKQTPMILAPICPIFSGKLEG